MEPDAVGADAPARRIGKACAPCHRKKVRCDGQQPCERCAAAGIECTYEPSLRRGRKRKSDAGHALNAGAAVAGPGGGLEEPLGDDKPPRAKKPLQSQVSFLISEVQRLRDALMKLQTGQSGVASPQPGGSGTGTPPITTQGTRTPSDPATQSTTDLRVMIAGGRAFANVAPPNHTLTLTFMNGLNTWPMVDWSWPSSQNYATCTQFADPTCPLGAELPQLDALLLYHSIISLAARQEQQHERSEVHYRIATRVSAELLESNANPTRTMVSGHLVLMLCAFARSQFNLVQNHRSLAAAKIAALGIPETDPLAIVEKSARTMSFARMSVEGKQPVLERAPMAAHRPMLGAVMGQGALGQAEVKLEKPPDVYMLPNPSLMLARMSELCSKETLEYHEVLSFCVDVMVSSLRNMAQLGAAELDERVSVELANLLVICLQFAKMYNVFGGMEFMVTTTTHLLIGTVTAKSSVRDAECVGAAMQNYQIALDLLQSNSHALRYSHPLTFLCIGNACMVLLKFGKVDMVRRFLDLVRPSFGVWSNSQPVFEMVQAKLALVPPGPPQELGAAQ